MRNRACGLFWLVIFLLATISPAQAQGSSGGAFLSAPNAERFPQIEANLKVYDAQGQFVHGLTAGQISILEDGAPRPAVALSEQRVGAQIVVAVNPGGAFAIRNAKAISRYDLLKAALRAWALSRAGSTLDDYSLLVSDGPTASHTANAVQWLGALESAPADVRQAAPTLDTLVRAVSLASDAPSRPGMGRMVLFITPPLEGQTDAQSLQNLAAQANEQAVPISVWLVTSSGAFSTKPAQQLMDLAAATGGQFFTFTGEEPLPNLETYLEPLRYLYQVSYVSSLQTSGDHALAARVQAGEASIDSLPVNLGLTIQPPAPAIVAPPSQIVRRLPASTPNPKGSLIEAHLAPDQLPIEVVFDFPDGRKREIVYSALLVDGAVVDENQEPPFERFNWKLDGYTEDGAHTLQVLARDTAGLSGSSLEIPVQVKVERPAGRALAGLQASLPVLAALAAALSGALLLLVMILGGRLRPRSQRVASSRRTRSDPVTQPVHITAEPAANRRASWASRFQLVQHPTAPQAQAFLYPLPEPDVERTIPPIPIPPDDLTIGSDAAQVGLALDDPSVEKHHATLTHQEDGAYRLADEGSIAGTWVNYTPVSKEGVCLEHGDLIHIGRVGFRFSLRTPTHTRRPVIVASPIHRPDADEQAPELSLANEPPEPEMAPQLLPTDPTDEESAL